MNEGTLGNWVNLDRQAREGTTGLSTGDVEELKRLRAENAELRMERNVLKRRPSDVVYRRLVADARANLEDDVEAGPGGHCEATLPSSAVDFHPHIDTSDQPLPGPAPTTLPPPNQGRKSPTRGPPQPAT